MNPLFLLLTMYYSMFNNSILNFNTEYAGIPEFPFSPYPNWYGMYNSHSEPTGMIVRASTQPLITFFTPNTVDSLRLYELSNIVPSINDPS